MPDRKYRTFLGEHHDGVHAFRAPERLDGVQCRLRDGPADVERCIHRNLDTYSSTERLEISISQRIRLFADDLQTSSTVRMDDCRKTFARPRLRARSQYHIVVR